MARESALSDETAIAETTSATNLLGPIRLNAALLSVVEMQANPAV